MIDLLVYLAILVIVLVLVYWLLSQATLPEPIKQIITIALVVVAVVVVIGLLLQLTGSPGLRLR